jgi:hypothetical protein
MLADDVRKDALRYDADAEFKRAALFFSDGSFIEFEHSSRNTRWARASADGTIAHKVNQWIRIFRLNAKHLQLFFEDGSDAEFVKHGKLH